MRISMNSLIVLFFCMCFRLLRAAGSHHGNKIQEIWETNACRNYVGVKVCQNCWTCRKGDFSMKNFWDKWVNLLLCSFLFPQFADGVSLVAPDHGVTNWETSQSLYEPVIIKKTSFTTKSVFLAGFFKVFNSWSSCESVYDCK